MSNTKGYNANKTKNHWIDNTGDIFSVNSTDWGTIQNSICGDSSTVQDDLEGVVVDAENQYARLYNSNQVHNSIQHRSMNNGSIHSNEYSKVNSNSYLPSAYTNECDESDYGDILIRHDSIDNVSTVTPATFAQRETTLDFSLDNERNVAAVSDDTSHEVRKVGLINTRRRKHIIGVLSLVVVLLLAVVVAVPVVVSTARAGDAQVSNAEKGVIGNEETNPDNDTPSSSENKSDDEFSEMNATIRENMTHHEDTYQIAPTGIHLSSNNASTAVDSEVVDPNHYVTGPTFEEESNPNQPITTATDNSASDQESISSDNYWISSADGDSNQMNAVESHGMSTNIPLAPSASPPTANSPNLLPDGQPQPAIEFTSQLDSSSGTVNSAGYEPTPVPSFTISTTALMLSSTSATADAAGGPTSALSLNTITPTYTNIIFPYSDDTEEFGSETSTQAEEEASLSVVNTIAPTPSPEPPTLQPTKFTESVVKLKLQTDRQGYETSWSLESIFFNSARNTNTSTVIAKVDENTYSSYQKDSKTFTLPQGTYRFTLRDSFGDGFCCKEFQGYFSISIDGREVIKGGYYRSEISYDFLVGYFPEMTERETQWLEAHNVRRKMWHESNGVSYVPLRWSSQLARQAEAWANKLTTDCKIIGIEHEQGVTEGENLAKNKADGRKGMGQLYPPDNILQRWVDQEADLPNPHNLHLTQALWRPTKYVGCGDAFRENNDGSVCRIQVCRYAKAGNCQMGKYNVTEGDNWLIPMLMDDSPCPPECPPEGCF
ncbi:hypothetical protein ACHAWX_006850 [Stephanocyclus meneghinianus]